MVMARLVTQLVWHRKKIKDIAGFIKIKTTAGAPASGVIGDMVFNTSDSKIYICKTANTFVATAALA